MTDEEIFDLAEQYGWMDDFGRWNFKEDRLISWALEVLRVKAEQQEPMAWAEITKDYVAVCNESFENAFPLYAAPPKREWVGLTDEEIKALPSWWPSYEEMPALMRLVRDIEAKLKEKNSG